MKEKFDIFRYRIKIGNILQAVFGISTMILIVLSFVFEDLFFKTFVLMVAFIIFQPVLVIFLTIINLSYFRKNHIYNEKECSHIIKLIAKNIKINDFFQFVSNKELMKNQVYPMIRKPGFGNPIYYSLPTEKELTVNYIYLSEISAATKINHPEAYNIALLDFESQLTAELMEKGIDCVMFQKNNDIVLICNVYQIENNSKNLNILFRAMSFFTRRSYSIPLYGNVVFLLKFLSTYRNYKCL